MNTDLLNYVNFPALIINEHGKVISQSKHIKQKYHISEGDDFFALCDSKISLSEFILNFSNMPLGSNDKCLTHFSFINNNIEVFVSIISKEPILFLIEYNADLLQDSSVVDLVDHSNNLLSLVDENYHYLSVNEQYSLKWGLQKSDIINQHVKTVLGEEAFNKVVKKELDLCFSGKVRTYTDWFYSENKKQRDEMLEITNKNNVMTRPAWTPMHRLKINQPSLRTDLKNTDWLFDRLVNVPSSVPQKNE